MNKAELIAAVAEKTELSKKDAEKALKAFTDVKSSKRETKYSLLVLELSRYLSALPEKEEIHRPARR